MASNRHSVLPPMPTMGRQSLVAIGVIVALGVALRIGLVIASPFDTMRGGDLQVYHDTANALAVDWSAWTRGGEFGWRAPLYFIYLALWYLPFDGQAPYWIGQLANIALLVPLSAVMAVLSRQIGLTERAAVFAVAIRLLAPFWIVADVQILSEPLFSVVLLVQVAIAVECMRMPERASTWAALGVSCSLALLTREVGMVLLLGIAAVFADDFRRKQVFPTKGLTICIVASMLTVAPWLARNHITYGQSLPISSTSGFNLHVGNNPEAEGRFVFMTAAGHVKPDSLKWGTPSADEWHKGMALRWIRENPVQFVRLVPERLAYLLFPRAARQEILGDLIFPKMSYRIAILIVILAGASSGLVILLSPLGLLAVSATSYGKISILMSLLLAAAVAVTYGAPRYHDPIVQLSVIGLALLADKPATLRNALRGSNGLMFGVTAMSTIALWILLLFTKLN